MPNSTNNWKKKKKQIIFWYHVWKWKTKTKTKTIPIFTQFYVFFPIPKDFPRLLAIFPFFSSHIIHFIFFFFSLRSRFYTYIEFVLLKYQDKRRRRELWSNRLIRFDNITKVAWCNLHPFPMNQIIIMFKNEIE